jgi:RNA polymerase sigma-70 factor, ECF subfamily
MNDHVTTGTLAEFESQRGRMFGIAYRMLGSATEAEDVVQDAWLRWQAVTEPIENPAAYLATIVTRLSLTALDSARVRRETYIGPWLPEPVSTADDPELVANHAESVNLAVLLLLERLSPAERAAYVLHEAFDYPFRQIAELLEISEANARQLGSRARAHLDRERGATVTGAERERLLAAFLAAAQVGDLAALESMLAEDVASFSDGGGVVGAARKVVVGRARVAQFILGVIEKFGEGVSAQLVEANGENAVLGVLNGHPSVVWSFDIGPDGVRELQAVLNPDKLGNFSSMALSHS